MPAARQAGCSECGRALTEWGGDDLLAHCLVRGHLKRGHYEPVRCLGSLVRWKKEE
jgi:hypothetical protein